MAGTLVIDTLKSGTSGPPAFKNTSDVEVGQLCRAWVTFAGSNGGISASFNVSSVTRTAAGSYTVNFANAFVDTKYTATGSIGHTATTYYACAYIAATKAVGSCSFYTPAEWTEYSMTFFR